jgi:aspartyl-tRNA synthetase
MSWRDLHCGEPRADRVGERLTVAGWADTRRDHGGLVFVDLRDHTGKLQLVVNPELAADAARVAHEVRNEFVLQATGTLVARAPAAVNPNLPTGEVELQVEELRILSRSTPLPFQLDEENVDETLRLRYRWLDMRTERMQRNLRLSHTVIAAIRRTMDERAFLDIWTPSMTRGTPEGARDFLVPVRLQPGKFFALAQSPTASSSFASSTSRWRSSTARTCSTCSRRPSSPASRRSGARRRRGPSRGSPTPR